MSDEESVIIIRRPNSTRLERRVAQFRIAALAEESPLSTWQRQWLDGFADELEAGATHADAELNYARFLVAKGL